MKLKKGRKPSIEGVFYLFYYTQVSKTGLYVVAKKDKKKAGMPAS